MASHRGNRTCANRAALQKAPYSASFAVGDKAAHRRSFSGRQAVVIVSEVSSSIFASKTPTKSRHHISLSPSSIDLGNIAPRGEIWRGAAEISMFSARMSRAHCVYLPEAAIALFSMQNWREKYCKKSIDPASGVAIKPEIYSARSQRGNESNSI